MIGFLALLLTLLLLVPLVLAATLLTEVLSALRKPLPVPPLSGRRPVVAVLVPAHDEEAGLVRTLDNVRAELLMGDRLLVIADNCSDGTATVALAAGADVRQRDDPLHRGKGYALDFGIRSLAADPPEVLLVIDADCLVAPGAIDRLAREALHWQRPVQALYLMRAPAGARPNGKIAEFAFIVKNLVRPLGLHRLGLPVPLTGTGMAFPWQLLDRVSLASGEIVEDMQLGIDLARHGAPVRFCPQALVHSEFPATAEGVRGQRTRWEHGHLGVLLKEGPRLLLHAMRRRSAGIAALALDLCVPPLALMALMLGGLLLVTLAFAVIGGMVLPLVLASASAAMFCIALVLAWRGFGREIVPLAELQHAASYMIAKIPVYLRFLGKRQSAWVRAKRDNEQ